MAWPGQRAIQLQRLARPGAVTLHTQETNTGAALAGLKGGTAGVEVLGCAGLRF